VGVEDELLGRALVEVGVALGPVRFEWTQDGDQSWVLQLHLATAAASPTTIHPGTASRWHRFDPSLGWSGYAS